MENPTVLQIIEYNESIARFMGLIYDKMWWRSPTEETLPWNPITYSLSRGVHREQLPYHLSWEWLMPVVLKIETLGFIVTITGHNFYIDGDQTSWRSKSYDKLQSAWSTIIEFIEWYDNQGASKNPPPA